MTTTDFNRIDQILVPTTAFTYAQKRLVQLFEASNHAAEPIAIALIGESRSGKSRILDHMRHQYPGVRKDEGLNLPVVYIKISSKPTVKGLVEALLHAIEDPLWNKRASETEKTERLVVLLKRVGARMIMLDEFQHFYDKVSHKVQHHVADWLKNLMDQLSIALVVAGLPNCTAVINQNEQLSGRFIGAVHIPRYRWVEPNERSEFKGIMKGFQHVLQDFEMPDLSSDNVAFRFYCASGGLIGYIAKILRQTYWDAQFEKRRTIGLNDFSQAFHKAVWNEGPIAWVDPFDMKFEPTPSPATLNQARQIGWGMDVLGTIAEDGNAHDETEAIVTTKRKGKGKY